MPAFAEPSGLVKTQLLKWKIQEFEESGIKVEVPEQTFGTKGGYYIKETASPKAVEGYGCKEITIKLHPVWMSGYMDEPFYLISVVIARLDEANYLKYKSNKHKIGGLDQFRSDHAVYHDKIKRYKTDVPGFQGRKKDILEIIRKDYRAPNGDYILCGGYIYAGSDKYIAPENEDIKAVERIFDSVQFLKDK